MRYAYSIDMYARQYKGWIGCDAGQHNLISSDLIRPSDLAIGMRLACGGTMRAPNDTVVCCLDWVPHPHPRAVTRRRVGAGRRQPSPGTHSPPTFGRCGCAHCGAGLSRDSSMLLLPGSVLFLFPA